MELATYNLLHTTCYLLPVTCYLTPDSCNLLPIICNLLPATYYLQSATCYLQLATCNLLPTTIFNFNQCKLVVIAIFVTSSIGIIAENKAATAKDFEVTDVGLPSIEQLIWSLLQDGPYKHPIHHITRGAHCICPKILRK